MVHANIYQLDSVREPECRRVLSLAAKTGWVTARDIAYTTGWSVATVKSALDQLIADRLIDVDGPTGRDIIHLTPRGIHAVQTLFDTRGIDIDG